jgi:hypothetical protein
MMEEGLNMKSRSNWRRYQRERHIKKRKRIVKEVYPSYCFPYFNYDGKFDTFKVHCSCGMCMAKTRNKKYRRRHIHANYAPSINYKISDKRKVEAMAADIDEYMDASE